MQQMPVYVLATVPLVLVLVIHITVQQVMLYAQIQLPHVAVQEAEQSLIVLHVLLIHMVYADIQYVTPMHAAKLSTPLHPAQLVKSVILVGLVILMLPQDSRVIIVPQRTTGATERVPALPQQQSLVLDPIKMCPAPAIPNAPKPAPQAVAAPASYRGP